MRPTIRLLIGAAALLGLVCAPTAIAATPTDRVAAMASFGASSGAIPPPDDPVSLEAFFDQAMSAQLSNGDVAGGVVAVVQDGQVVFQEGYGYAATGLIRNRRRDTIAPNPPPPESPARPWQHSAHSPCCSSSGSRRSSPTSRA